VRSRVGRDGSRRRSTVSAQAGGANPAGCPGERRTTAGPFPSAAAGRSQKDPVGLLQTRTSNLTAKNRQLVPKHDDLELLELTRTKAKRRHRERTSKQQIHQRYQQGETPSDQDAERGPTLRSRTQLGPPEQPDGFTHPTGRGVRRLGECSAKDGAVAAESLSYQTCGVRKFGRTSQNIRFAGKTEFTHPTGRKVVNLPYSDLCRCPVRSSVAVAVRPCGSDDR
jgi:hypothetical protein